MPLWYVAAWSAKMATCFCGLAVIGSPDYLVREPFLVGTLEGFCFMSGATSCFACGFVPHPDADDAFLFCPCCAERASIAELASFGMVPSWTPRYPLLVPRPVPFATWEVLSARELAERDAAERRKQAPHDDPEMARLIAEKVARDAAEAKAEALAKRLYRGDAEARSRLHSLRNDALSMFQVAKNPRLAHEFLEIAERLRLLIEALPLPGVEPLDDVAPAVERDKTLVVDRRTLIAIGRGVLIADEVGYGRKPLAVSDKMAIIVGRATLASGWLAYE